MHTLWGVPYFAWLAACLLIAIIYLIFFPREAQSEEISPVTRIILRYAHGLVWIWLAVACVFAHYNNMTMVYVAVFASLITYIIFVVTFLRVKFSK